MRSVFHWNLGSRSLELGQRTLIMGVVNVTPDSFFDGGKFLDRDKAVAQALRLLEQGADIIDIGGESTRPGARIDSGREQGSTPNIAGAPPVTAEEELRRVIPVISELKKKNSTALISIDTYKAAVAREAAQAGAEIVNDVSGFVWDPAMAETLAGLNCGAVLMHMRGRPEQWRQLSPADDIVLLVKRELKARAEKAVLAGVERERIVLDPGFGFGKNFEENYPLISRLEDVGSLGFPLLVGVSRKSFIGKTLGGGERKAPPGERLYGTLAAQTALLLKGAHILRTHDVKASLEAARVADAILEAH